MEKAMSLVYSGIGNMELEDFETSKSDESVLPSDIVVRNGNRVFQLNAPKTWQEVPFIHRMLYLEYLLHPNTNVGWQRLMTHWLQSKGVSEKAITNATVFTPEKWLWMRYCFRGLDFKNIDGKTPILTGFKAQGVDFQLIADGFKDGCIYEYARASDYYAATMQGKMEKALDLLSVLCRPVVKGTPQSLRHIGDVSDRKRLLSQLPIPKQQAYLFASVRHFEACKQFIYEKWHPIFQTGEGSSKPTMDLGWDGQIMAQASDLTKLPEVQQTNVHTFCYWLLKKKIDDDAYNAALNATTH
jgi:hypothetical protein